MNIRESMELREQELLSPFASHSTDTRGRDRPEEECDVRTAYQRDRDRILHCKAFRRMKDKTQVFLAPQGDHYRTRLTHTLEVSQIARTIARALRLNEDLVEAIALGHDLGHTPFGHSGEKALEQVHPGGFAHYKQSVRVVEILEKNGNGLNLTWEVRDGMKNHRTSGKPSTLEGQVVRFSDKIAYIHHDMDDAQRAGIITEDDIPVTMRTFLGYTTRERLNTFVHNIIENSLDKDSISMSPDVYEAMMDLRSLMFRNVYENPVAKKEEERAMKMLTELYEYYTDHPEAMPGEYRELAKCRGVPKEQAVCDYISGMTDQYSMKKFRELYIPKCWEVY
ncbi:MAG: deoxyguanosinetriphosphate triphosphohydrolase [Eubacteriales bacterium]|nr:deoxyguanosinetriphosphate triphosphohydrolase [Eubacteriales bacterium]